MFGTEHVQEATNWLKKDATRSIKISSSADGFLDISFVQGEKQLAFSSNKNLMDALKASLSIIKGQPNGN